MVSIINMTSNNVLTPISADELLSSLAGHRSHPDTWYCGNCGDGPNSSEYQICCPNCGHSQDGFSYAHAVHPHEHDDDDLSISNARDDLAPFPGNQISPSSPLADLDLKSTFRRCRSMWTCCNGHGPMSRALHDSCPECGHRCGDCCSL